MVRVYAAHDGRRADDYPEADERNRRWMPPSEAATLVDEPGLRDLLRQL